MTEQIKQRKTEHVNISLQNDISAPQAASWADIRLVHRALPEVDLDEIDLSVDFLGAQLRHPLWISSLTGGHPDVAAINERLGKVAEEYGLAMGVGSQRAALGSRGTGGDLSHRPRQRADRVSRRQYRRATTDRAERDARPSRRSRRARRSR